jgi:hypothetical protein
MWETVRAVLLSPNATMVMGSLLILVVIISVLSRKGILSINTKGLTLGADVQERDIIRQQVEWTHNYIMSLYPKIQPKTNNRYDGYYTKYMLEIAYSEIVDWITFNHIKLDSDYIDIKQATMRSVIYSHEIDSVFKTPEFEQQIDEWVEEIIRKLAAIRAVYNK